MEILILLIALLAGQKKQADFLRPLGKFLESGEISAIIKSDWFRAQTFGSVNGKELAEAYENAAKLAEGGLLRALGGKDVQSAAETIAGLAPALSALFAQQKADPQNAEAAESAAENPFAPIAPFADAQIVYSLNRYFSA